MGFGALLNPQLFHLFPSGGVPLKLPLSFFLKFIYLFIFGCVGSLLLHAGFL